MAPSKSMGHCRFNAISNTLAISRKTTGLRHELEWEYSNNVNTLQTNVKQAKNVPHIYCLNRWVIAFLAFSSSVMPSKLAMATSTTTARESIHKACFSLLSFINANSLSNNASINVVHVSNNEENCHWRTCKQLKATWNWEQTSYNDRKRWTFVS